MIVIDIDLPESCEVCPFSAFNTEWLYYYCPFLDNADVSEMIDCRHNYCPLKEGEPITESGKIRKEVKKILEEQQRQHGEWVWQTEDKYRCTACGANVRVEECMNEPQYDFCPSCGADMRKEGEQI